MAKKRKGPSLSDVKRGVAVDVIAFVLGLSVRRVQQLVAEKALPGAIAPGLYDLAACVKARIDHAERGGDAGGARVRDLIAAARIKEAKAAALESRYIDRDELEELLTRIGVDLAAQLDGTAGRVAAEVVAVTGGDRAKVQAILFAEHRKIRATMADAVERACKP
jgi:hypothetical protein